VKSDSAAAGFFFRLRAISDPWALAVLYLHVACASSPGSLIRDYSWPTFDKIFM